MKEKVVIYHNPRCSKSREAISLLNEAKIEYTIKEYLKDSPNLEELKKLIHLLKIKPIDLLRKGEDEYKTLIKDKDLSNEEILQIIIDNPKLIERPIVITENKAVIGRPPSLIIDLLK